MENSQFWYLKFRVGTKIGQKIKSVCCVKVVENGAESLGGHTKIHFSSYFYYYD